MGSWQLKDGALAVEHLQCLKDVHYPAITASGTGLSAGRHVPCSARTLDCAQLLPMGCRAVYDRRFSALQGESVDGTDIRQDLLVLGRQLDRLGKGPTHL